MRFLNTCLAVGVVAVLAGAAGCGTDKKSNDDQDATTGPGAELTAEEKAALEAEYSKIPQAAIVRVKLDDQGNPVGSPEMKVAEGGADGLTSAEAAALAFEGGAAPQNVVANVDELDSDSSVQSWTNWGDGKNYDDGGDFGQDKGPGQGGQGPGQGGQGPGQGGQNPGQGGYNPGQGGQQGPGGQGPGGQGGYKPVPGQGGGHPGQGGNCGQQQVCSCQRSYCHDYWYTGYRPVLYWHGYGWNYGAFRPWYYRQGNYGYYCYRPQRRW